MNKKLILSFSLLVLFASHNILAADSQVNWYSGSYESAKKQAYSQYKEVFIYFYTPWCQYCTELQKNVFPNSEIAQILNYDFISIKIDASKKENSELVAKYKVRWFPTMIVDKEQAKVTFGYKSVNVLKKWLTGVLKG